MNSPVKIWRNQKKITKMLRKEGRIISWTIVRVPPTGFSYIAPYPIAIVKLNGGKNIVAQITDWSGEEIKIGMKVVTVVRRTFRPEAGEVIPYGIKVKLLN